MSEYEVYLLIAFLFGLFGLVSLFSATVDGRRPALAIVMLLICGGAFFMASHVNTVGMKVSDVPRAFLKIAQMLVQ